MQQFTFVSLFPRAAGCFNCRLSQATCWLKFGVRSCPCEEKDALDHLEGEYDAEESREAKGSESRRAENEVRILKLFEKSNDLFACCWLFACFVYYQRS